MIRVSLRRLFPGASFVGGTDIAAIDTAEDSRRCTPGCVFAVVAGKKANGRAFLQDAIQRGATALLCRSPIAEVDLPQCVVPDVRQAYGELCQALHGWPAQRLGTIGVTGTNGKTTVTWMIQAILEQAARPTGVLGTIHYHDGIESTPARLTTPDAHTLARWLGAMSAKNTEFAAMELSSHALDQRRAAGIQLDVGIVTNVTHDHFDYHVHFENYRLAKARMLSMLKPSGLILWNADDRGCESLVGMTPRDTQVKSFGILSNADITGKVLDLSLQGTQFEIRAGLESITVTNGLIGRHNVSNALAAAGAALHFGLSLADIRDGLQQLGCVPGRMQRIPRADGFDLFVDYAHSEDALRRAIHALRDGCRGRVILVFGAGGERDASKRPLMGRVAAKADLIVVTSDNPRREDPTKISDEICAGLRGVGGTAHIEPDRELAIAWALKNARAGDAVLIAGKGHENFQLIGDERIPFDDVAICNRLLSGHPIAGPHWDDVVSTTEVAHVRRS